MLPSSLKGKLRPLTALIVGPGAHWHPSFSGLPPLLPPFLPPLPRKLIKLPRVAFTEGNRIRDKLLNIQKLEDKLQGLLYDQITP